jgi:lysozyme
MSLEKLLREREGFKDYVYEDTMGNPTIGTGHKLPEKYRAMIYDPDKKGSKKVKPFTNKQLEEFFQEDIKIAKNSAMANFNNFNTFPVSVQEGLINQAFQLGQGKQALFTEMKKGLDSGDYNKAMVEALDSNWNTQTPKRSNDLANIFREQIPSGQEVNLVPEQTSVPLMRPSESNTVPNQNNIIMEGIKQDMNQQAVPQPKSFNQAFGEARQQQGSGGTFEWNGNSYSTNIAGEVPAVAEPMFPREEFVPTVPPRVTSTADSRINVPPFEGLEIPELGFNNGTNSVPGYNNGSNFISDFFNKYFNAGAVRNNQRVQEQEIINSVLDKNILDQENKEKAIMEDAQINAQINAQRNAPAVPKLPDEKIIQTTLPKVKVPMNFSFNADNSLDNRVNALDTQRQIDRRSNMYSKSTADGSYGDPQAGYSQQPVPMVVNATPVYNNGYQIKSDRFGVPEAVSPFLIDPENMKRITKRYADNKITAEQYQLQKKEFDNAVYQDQAHKDYLSKSKEQKDIVSNEENLNSISILDQRIAEAKEAGDNVLVAELEANKNKLLESTTGTKVTDASKTEVDKKDNTVSTSNTTATLPNGNEVDLSSEEQNKIDKGTPNNVKEQIGSMLQTFFGLETSDVTRAIGFYLASRATGASHAGSMRWAGGTVLKQAENRNILNSKKSDTALTAFAKVSGKYKPSAASKISKLLTEGKLVEAQTEMSKSSNMTARGQMGISKDDAGTQMIRRGYTTPTTVFTGTNGIYYEKITGKKDGKTFETYKPLTTADSNQLRPLGASDTNFNYLNNARKILDDMPSGYFRQAGKDPNDPKGEEKPAGLFGVGDKTGVMADIRRLSEELAGKGVPNMPEALALKLSGLAQLAESQGIKAISASQLLEIGFSGSDSLIDSKLITKDGDEETIIPSAEIVDFTKEFRKQFNNDYNTSNKNMSTVVTEYREVKPSSIKVIEQLDEFKSLTDTQKEEVKSAPNLFMSYALTKAYSNNK